jgi:hypothetical protein
MQILISNIDRTDKVRIGSIEIEDAINERSMARLQLVDTSMSLDLVDGQPIQIYDDSAILIFAGFLLFPKKYVPITDNAIFFDLECVDNHLIADRFLVAKTYLNTSAQDIANDLYYTYLEPEGVTIGAIDGVSLFPSSELFPSDTLFPFSSTVILEQASFPRVGTVSDAMNELAEITGYQWYIDYDKKFYFAPRTFFNAPFDIIDTSAIVNVQVRQDKSQYRNRQYIRGGRSETDLITLEKPTPNPDGVSRTFITRFPVASKPQIFINSVEVNAADIGINGIDTGKRYYYVYNQNTIVQDDAETILSGGDVIEVTYRGLVSLALVAQNSAAIAERASVEGGSGVYERIDVDEAISSRQEALDIANGKLTKYSKILREITYDTFTPGLAAGQLQNVNLTQYGISSTDFLIDNIQISEIESSVTNKTFIFTVHAIDGETFGGWQKFYRDLLRQNLKTSIREDEFLVVLESIDEAQGWDEDTTINIFACSTPSESLFPSESLIPC